jgi:hypothetical protein
VSRGIIAGLVSPAPFVRALWRPALLRELLVLVAVALPSLAIVADFDLAQLPALLTADAVAMQRAERIALSIRAVSVVAAVASMYWYAHLVRMLPGIGAWAYPAVGARLRNSLLLLAALLGAVTLLVFAPRLPLSHSLALAAVAAAWVAWPLSLHVPIPALLRSVLLLVPPVVVLWPGPVSALADGPWTWLVLGLCALVLVAAAAAVTPSGVRRAMYERRPGQDGPRWIVGHEPSVGDAAGEPSLQRPTTVRAQALAVDRGLSPRFAWVPALPAWAAGLPAITGWALLPLLWHAINVNPLIMLSGLVGSAYFAEPAFWWPLGRVERLRVTRWLVWRQMLLRAVVIVGAGVLYVVCDLPRFPFVEDADPARHWIQWPLLVAAFPLVHGWHAPSPVHPTVWAPLLRLLLVMPALTVLAAWAQRAGQQPLTLVLALLLLGAGLWELEWRLRRRYLRADLHPSAVP